MKNPIEVKNILESKIYLGELKDSLFATGTNGEQKSVSAIIYNFANLYEKEMTLNDYDRYKVSLALSIKDSLSKLSIVDCSIFQPAVFFLLKFDFAIAADSDANGTIRLFLLDSLARASNLPLDSLTIGGVHNCKGYLQFILYVESIHAMLPDKSKEQPSPQSDQDRPSYLDDILAAGPKNTTFQGHVSRLEEAKRQFEHTYASQFADALKEEVLRRGKEYDSIGEKRELVEWLNAEVKRMGLTYKNPKIDATAILVVDSGQHLKQGRFQLRTKAENSGTGKKVSFNTESVNDLLDNIKLVDIPPRHEAFGKGSNKKSSNSSSETGRA